MLMVPQQHATAWGMWLLEGKPRAWGIPRGPTPSAATFCPVPDSPSEFITPKRWVWVSGFIHNTHRDHALGPCTGDLEPHSDQKQDPNAPRPLAAQAADPCSSLHLCTTQQNRGSGCQNHRNKSSSRWQGTRAPANSPQLPSARRSDRAPLPAATPAPGPRTQQMHSSHTQIIFLQQFQASCTRAFITNTYSNVPVHPRHPKLSWLICQIFYYYYFLKYLLPLRPVKSAQLILIFMDVESHLKVTFWFFSSFMSCAFCRICNRGF